METESRGQLWSVHTYRTNPKKTSGHGTLRKHLCTEHGQASSPGHPQLQGTGYPRSCPKDRRGEPMCLCPRLCIYNSYPAGHTGALPGLCECHGDLGDQDIDAKCGHSDHGVFNVIIKCDINVMGQCSCPQPQRVPVHGLGGHVTPREPMYASETDLHGAEVCLRDGGLRVYRAHAHLMRGLKMFHRALMKLVGCTT